ncbi:PREDICTED: uncharacterized protein LOC104601820 [Nelumbo nucifera]|uniref:beta-galactosidase n=1 Tax=Nelumbo nucifera TaxID=4432 RepID=A0A1U8AMF8_NELNU|nr:PREDICTED: uncharacterized protein LOC104601820 [Nelumbo nucifera]
MWPELVKTAKEGGADAIETYVFWNGHELSPGNQSGTLGMPAAVLEFRIYSTFRRMQRVSKGGEKAEETPYLRPKQLLNNHRWPPDREMVKKKREGRRVKLGQAKL